MDALDFDVLVVIKLISISSAWVVIAQARGLCYACVTLSKNSVKNQTPPGELEMHLMRLWPFTLALRLPLVTMSSGPALAALQGFHALEIGDAAPDFELRGVDDQRHALKDFAKSKLLLIILTCNHCPTAQA
jgi:hypothetical protein